MQRKLGNTMVACVVGGLTRQEGIDAVLNAANAQLMLGGGVADAIRRAAGPELVEGCHRLVPIKPGQAVITSGYWLSNPYVIHCLGPVYGEGGPSALLLADCYRKALRLADEHRLSSIAFPAISTGIFGHPPEEAAGVALSAIAEVAGSLRSVRLVRLVLHNGAALTIHKDALASLVS